MCRWKAGILVFWCFSHITVKVLIKAAKGGGYLPFFLDFWVYFITKFRLFFYKNRKVAGKNRPYFLRDKQSIFNYFLYILPVFDEILPPFLGHFIVKWVYVTDRVIHILYFFCDVILKKKQNPVTEKVPLRKNNCICHAYINTVTH